MSRIFAWQEFCINIQIIRAEVYCLNIRMDLETKIFQPYKKPGDISQYVSDLSNHPFPTFKIIPVGKEQILSDNSADEHIFNPIPPCIQSCIAPKPLI